MGAISEKLVYLNGTKQAIKQAINEDFEVIDNNTTFREYADEISSNNAKYKDLIPKETKNATNTLDISNSAGLDKALVTQYGNTYQEGEPAPENPQDIHVVTGDNTIKVEGKNLLKYPYLNTTSTVSGVTFTDNGDGSITIDGTSTSSTYALWFLYENAWNYNKLSFELNPGTYTFKGLTTNKVTMACNFYFSDNSNEYFFIAQKDVTKTITEKVKLNMRLLVAGGTSVNNVTIYPQIEKGNTPTTYEPYKGASYPISLGNIELCKISTYKDRIYPLNGKWYLEKKIGKVVLDGSESWATNQHSSTNYRYVTSLSDSITITNQSTDIYCKNNYFKGVGAITCITPTPTENMIAVISNNRILVNTIDSNLFESATFKTWLSTHNAIVYYVLATPTTTEITENNYPTLYNQLNNIKLFEGVNHITMTNESGLDVEFDITYYKDWKLD